MPKADKKTLLGLEKQYWEAVRNHDGTVAAGLTDEQCIIVDAQGIQEVDPERAKEMLNDRSFDLEQYGLDEKELKFRAIGNDVAIVSYPVHELMSIGGKPAKRLDLFDTTVWVRQNGSWVCALHTETPAATLAA